MLIAPIIAILVAWLLYQVVKPPGPRIFRSENGPPVTSPRIRLRDGRYLAYRVRGAAKENAKYKVILSHGFCASKETYIPVSDEWLQELGIHLITFDRPGYAESDPNPKRSPKCDAFDIQELADQLELGHKVYLVGLSIGSYPVWGCLKYLPHRVAGVALVGPIINYWWPSLPSGLCNETYRSLQFMEQLRLWMVHHTPYLAWLLQRWLPLPTVDIVLKKNPKAFNESDLVVMNTLSQVPAPDKHKIQQQGAYESMHRDFTISYGTWEFDPLDLSNPFPDKSGSVHLWMGSQDGFISVELQRLVSRRLPWIRRHEIPRAGHLFIHDRKSCEMVLRSLVLGEDPSFEQ